VFIAKIIINLTFLGISTGETEYFDIETYFEIVELEIKMINIEK